MLGFSLKGYFKYRAIVFVRNLMFRLSTRMLFSVISKMARIAPVERIEASGIPFHIQEQTRNWHEI